MRSCIGKSLRPRRRGCVRPYRPPGGFRVLFLTHYNRPGHPWQGQPPATPAQLAAPPARNAHHPPFVFVFPVRLPSSFSCSSSHFVFVFVSPLRVRVRLP